MSEKLVPQLDHQGYVIGAVVADKSPLEQDVYLIPGGAIDAEMPNIQPGKRARWIANSFYLEDMPQHPPEQTLTPDDVKMIAWNHIKNDRDRRIQSAGYKVGTKWFHSDTFSRSQQLGLVLLGSGIPADLQWKTMDGSFVTMTATLAQQILGAAAASDQAIFAAAEAHKAAMEVSSDPSAYNFSTGWPKAYGE